MIKLPIDKYYLVDVPMSAYDIEIGIPDHKLWYLLPDADEFIIIPKGCKIISDNIADIKEDQAKGMGVSLSELHAAFKSVGVVWRNELDVKEHSFLGLMSGNYQAAQSLVKRYVLIEKEGRDE